MKFRNRKWFIVFVFMCLVVIYLYSERNSNAPNKNSISVFTRTAHYRSTDSIQSIANSQTTVHFNHLCFLLNCCLCLFYAVIHILMALLLLLFGGVANIYSRWRGTNTNTHIQTGLASKNDYWQTYINSIDIITINLTGFWTFYLCFYSKFGVISSFRIQYQNQSIRFLKLSLRDSQYLFNLAEVYYLFIYFYKSFSHSEADE